jgi:hypothetical protein
MLSILLLLRCFVYVAIDQQRLLSIFVARSGAEDCIQHSSGTYVRGHGSRIVLLFVPPLQRFHGLLDFV